MKDNDPQNPRDFDVEIWDTAFTSGKWRSVDSQIRRFFALPLDGLLTKTEAQRLALACPGRTRIVRRITEVIEEHDPAEDT